MDDLGGSGDLGRGGIAATPRGGTSADTPAAAVDAEAVLTVLDLAPHSSATSTCTSLASKLSDVRGAPPGPVARTHLSDCSDEPSTVKTSRTGAIEATRANARNLAVLLGGAHSSPWSSPSSS
jgi:hypothetical protein